MGRETLGRNRASLDRRRFVRGAAAGAVVLAAPAIVRAQGGLLRVGVLLPYTGFEAGNGQDNQRGIDVAPPILKSLGYPELSIMTGDTESSIDTARERAEKLIGAGAQLLIGAFDSGQTTVIAQVAEQKGIPFVVNVAAAPDITEQGYKFVFRSFPTAPMVLADAFVNQKELFAITGITPKTVVYLHVNDTFGTSMSKGIVAMMPKFDMPYTVVADIPYDPQARDLSVEVAKAKAANPDALMVTSRLNDSILITRELIKQRWTPAAIFSMGPGWIEDQYLKTLGKYSDGPMGFNPWEDPNKKLTPVLDAAIAKAYPGVSLNSFHVYSFEAMLTAADAYKRAGSTDPKALAEAIRTTNITDNCSIGAGISFNAKGQNDKSRCGVTQNRGGKQVVLAPKAAANAKPEWPMTSYLSRG
jgi:branched-chain amino acid transport system substrate-binding protein